MNPFSRLLGLLPKEPLRVATVSSDLGSGNYILTFDGGGTLKARSQGSHSVSDRVYVKGTTIQGAAPSLTLVNYDI